MIRGVFFLDASTLRFAPCDRAESVKADITNRRILIAKLDTLHRFRRISIQLRKHHLVPRDRVDGYSLSYEPAAERRLVESEQKGSSYCDYYRQLS